jgi:hypothetical protein
MTRSITPTNSNNILEITALINVGGSGAGAYAISALFQDATANALTASYVQMAASLTQAKLQYTMTAGTTSSTTFRVRVGTNSGGGTTVTINGESGAAKLGGVFTSSIIIKEYLP